MNSVIPGQRARASMACLAAATLAGVLFAAQPSHAALVELTWDGVTARGVDKIGLFGAPTTDFQSTTYRAVYVFDTSVGFVANPTNGSEEVTGGTFFNPPSPSPVVSAAITVNGVTLNLGASFYGTYYSRTGQGSSAILAEADADPALDQGTYASPYGTTFFQSVFRLGDFYGLPLAMPASYAFTAADNPRGRFSFLALDGQRNILNDTGFDLVPTSLTIGAPAGGGGGPVPEPSTWAMLILGFGVAGAMLRRRPVASSRR